MILNACTFQVRNEIEMEILEKKYLCDVLKREYWDSMKVKGRAVRVSSDICYIYS